MLSSAVIDGHSCSVNERRAIFGDGHVEITRRFSATDLSGLLLRIESESEPATIKVLTERRDIRLDVTDDVFVVPTDFRKVERLSFSS